VNAKSIGFPEKRGNLLTGILIALYFLWLAFSLSSYYLVQNAFLQPAFAQLSAGDFWLPVGSSMNVLIGSLVDILAAVWIAFVALGLGRPLLTLFSVTQRSFLDEFIFALGLGFGILGMLALVLGLIGLLKTSILIIVLSALTLLTIRPSLGYLRQAPRPRPGKLIALFLILALLLSVTLAFLPATSWDGLFYHLNGPKLYLEAGRIAGGIDIPHLNFPFLLEMLFALGMAIRSDATAVLIHYLFLPLLIGLVYLIARDLLKVANGWLAILLLLAVPMVLSLASWAYNDLALAFYEVGALYAVLRWRLGEHRSRRIDENQEPLMQSRLLSWTAKLPGWLLISGIFCGFAMGLKYTSFVAPLTIALLILWWFRTNLRVGVRYLLLFGFLAIVVASPWFLKNLAFTGNPVYPFLFGGHFWDEFRSNAYSEAGTGIAFNPDTCLSASSNPLVGQNASECSFDPTYLVKRLITLPYDLTLGIQDASRDGDTGPLFLLLFPLFLVYVSTRSRKEVPKALWAFLFFTAISYAFWVAGVIMSAPLWQSRLLLPAFVTLCPALAWMLEDLGRFDIPNFSLKRLLYLVLGAVLVIGLVIQLLNWLTYQPWSYLTGAEPREQYLERRLGAHFLAMETINNSLPVDASVVFLWEPRSYYCQRECRPDSIIDEFGHLLHLHGDAQGIAQFWREEDISHVLIYRTGLDFILLANSPTGEPLPVPNALDDLFNNHLDLISSVGGGAYELYRLSS
jgi:4-amino-4-deoxy-L-arabinose transferase-like glycosyltransferase